jgi:transposase
MLMVERLAAGWSVAEVATAAGVTTKTVRKWRDRFAAEGEPGLRDRSSRPHRSPMRLPAAAEAQAWAGSICTSPSMTPRASPTPR